MGLLKFFPIMLRVNLFLQSQIINIYKERNINGALYSNYRLNTIPTKQSAPLKTIATENLIYILRTEAVDAIAYSNL